MSILSKLYPVPDSVLAVGTKSSKSTLGRKMIFPQSEEDIMLCDLAILTLDTKPQVQSSEIRRHLYGLFCHHSMKVCDLGSLIYEETPSENVTVLEEIIKHLVTQNVLPIVLGGDQNTNAGVLKIISQSKQRPTHLGRIAATIGDSFLEYLSSKKHTNNFSLIGGQSYLIPPTTVEALETYNVYGLASVRRKIESCEPVLRIIDILSVDLNVVQRSDYASSLNISGLSSFELCNIFNFGGISNNLDCILVDKTTSKEMDQSHAEIIAQAIWCFMEKLATRVYDYPSNDDNYHFYTISLNQEFIPELVFCQSLKGLFSRWWVRIDYSRDHLPVSEFVPCEKEDYLACKDLHILPEVWKKWYRKLTTLACPDNSI